MKVLIIDDSSEEILNILQGWSVPDTEVVHSSGGPGAINYITKGDLGAVFISTEYFTIQNLDILNLIKEKNSGVEIFIISDRDNTEQAEKALSRGAHSILTRPLKLELFESVVRKTMVRALTRANHRELEEHLMIDLLGSTPAMDKILNTLTKVAPTNSSILVEGETGTGKEFLANLIHRMSNRQDEPFIAVNCAAIPESLIEAELFGSKKGSFTGAISDRRGLFEEADNGTLFLDEIGDLPQSMQVKLLRFLQEKEIRRIGENESKIVDVRVIAATNVNLIKSVKEGKFREDLFYRLNVFHFNIPPLRERKANIPHMIRYFVKKYSKEAQRHIKGIAKEAEHFLMNYDYPGNIRELENIIEHAVVMCDGEYILISHLPEKLVSAHQNFERLALPKSNNVNDAPSNIKTLSQLEKDYIIQTLQFFNNNQTEVAKKLGISRSTLWRKIKEHQISL